MSSEPRVQLRPMKYSLKTGFLVVAAIAIVIAVAVQAIRGYRAADLRRALGSARAVSLLRGAERVEIYRIKATPDAMKPNTSHTNIHDFSIIDSPIVLNSSDAARVQSI